MLNYRLISDAKCIPFCEEWLTLYCAKLLMTNKITKHSEVVAERIFMPSVY